MKRTGLLLALLLTCGMAFPTFASPQHSPISISQSTTEPNATEKQILKLAGNEAGISYLQMLDLFRHGQVTITEIAGGGYQVRIAQADGNPIIIDILHGI
jgi:hypothetical protein